ncbi:hypothetical protein, partial [Lactobacillus delbrueckii]|uniref:hypothetical protein n=1 Tax=Lactobacillus delbrueckii TaxID=1584 RepID=UPI002363CB50
MTLAAAIFLKEAGCNLAQGSLFSPPVPLDELYKKWHLIYRQKKTASHRASGFSGSIIFLTDGCQVIHPSVR